MLKKEARRIYNKKRQEISYTDRLKWDDLILINFQTIDIPFLQSVFSFYPMEDRNEINAFIITDYLHFRNPSLRICYPKMDMKEPNMEAYVCHADTIFQANEINILEPLESEIVEPQDIDLVLVPMLVCDVEGNRVGYGKGYYDNFLSQCRPETKKIGVSLFTAVAAITDVHERDMALDAVLTPDKIYQFS